MMCEMGACEQVAVIRAWFSRPGCCGYLEHVTPVCAEGHGDIAARLSTCPACGQASRVRITKRKKIRTNHGGRGR